MAVRGEEGQEKNSGGAKVVRCLGVIYKSNRTVAMNIYSPALLLDRVTATKNMSLCRT